MLLLVLTICCPGLLAQQVVATAGSTFDNSGRSITFTIGEGVAQTLTNGDLTLTQGFHQTTVSVKSISELKELDFSISVSPNPTSDFLKIKVTKEDVTGLQFLLLDINGKLILQKNLEGNETSLSIDKLTDGLYILMIKEGPKELKTFKVIKK